MDLELRLAALSQLINNKSKAVERRLGEEFRSVEYLLQHSTDYDELIGALRTLAVLAVRFHGAVLPLLSDFVHSISSRTLTQGGKPISTSWLPFRSAEQLIREAIDAVNPVRYVHTEAVVDLLLGLSRVDDRGVSGKASQTLEALATFDLDIYYGNPGLGAQPQTRIVTHLTSLDNTQLEANAGVIFGALRKVLSPSMEGHSWTYNSLIISRGEIMGDADVAEMRADAIELLKRMYRLSEAINYRKNVLSTLNAATHQERPASSADAATMFERDAKIVLNFLTGLVATEALPLVQTIEHQAYWNYHHAASPAIELAALAVRDVIKSHVEYQIYKNLIGFEGIFGEWEDLRRSESAWTYDDTKRHVAARQYLEQIDSASYAMWRDRILEFSKTRSEDLATFPVYYEFLESIGRERPSLALELISDHIEVMSPFLIALLRGLWTSSKEADIERIVDSWIADGVRLVEITKSFYKAGLSRLSKLSAVIDRCAELDIREPLVHVMGIAASLSGDDCEPAKVIFMQALRELTKHDNVNWANAVWYNRDFRSLISTMNPSERAEILTSLEKVAELSFQAVEVLSTIAEFDIQSIIDFFNARLKRERAGRGKDYGANKEDEVCLVDTKFEAIPYELHKLDKQLTKVPDRLLLAMQHDFEEEDHSLFTYRGARLIKAVFPAFGEPLEGILEKLVEGGVERDISFVLCLLRVYEGADSILPLCKSIIKVSPEKSKQWDEVASIIESTGVVSGEFGRANAFEAKRSEIGAWLADGNSRVQAFALWLIESLNRIIDSEKQRASDDIALRKYKFGVGKDSSKTNLDSNRDEQ